MTKGEQIESSLLWWKTLPFESRFYKVIEWLKSNDRNVTERHPDSLTGHEIYEIWKMQKF